MSKFLEDDNALSLITAPTVFTSKYVERRNLEAQSSFLTQIPILR